MANVKGGLVNKNAAAVSAATGAKKVLSPLALQLKSENTLERFTQNFLGDKAKAEKFLSAALSLVNNDKALAKCSPASVMAGLALVSLTGLSLNPNYGQAYLIGYSGTAQVQIGYKGYLKMMQNTGLYEKIIMTPVYEGEMIKANRFEEEYEFDEASRVSDVVIGYYVCFKLLNGFAKKTYWTKDNVIKHAKKFSKAYGSGPWQTDFDAMAIKTVFKSVVKFAPMSEEMEKAIEADADFKKTEVVTGSANETIDIDVEDIGGVADPVDIVNNDVDVAVEELFKEQ